MEATATADAEDSPFEPSLWNDFFVTYTPPISQMSEKRMRERADNLKREVHHMFDAQNGLSLANTLMLVDALERLGIDNHFQEEIDAVLCRVHNEELELGSSNELHIVALRFRLLRQHGFFVSTDVFDNFKDGTGNFSTALTEDPRGLLSLYNAAHMAVPGDDVLDDIIVFTRFHLEALKGKLGSPISDQIGRALNIPLPRYMLPLETMHYITEYEQEEVHNLTVLELARLDYSIKRSVHLKELQVFCVWWKDLYEDVKLTYSRDRSVELYFWAFGMIHGEGYSHARIQFSKMIAFISLMDDTYDAHATIEECQKLTEAIQRWDEHMAYVAPEYLRAFYIKTLSIFNEFKDMLELGEKYRASDVQKEFMLLSRYYLEEAKWCSEKYIPCFKDQLDLSTMSSAIPLLTLGALMAVGDAETTDAFKWARDVPDIIRACGEMARLLNDVSAFKKGRKNKNDIASSVECYMKEHETTGDEAAAALVAMVELAWRRINQLFMEIDRALLPAVKMAVINLARVCEIIYCGGNDAYTFTGDLADLVTSLFLKPIHV